MAYSLYVFKKNFKLMSHPMKLLGLSNDLKSAKGLLKCFIVPLVLPELPERGNIYQNSLRTCERLLHGARVIGLKSSFMENKYNIVFESI